MSDPRVTKLAKLLVHYSVQLQPKQQVIIRTSPAAEELTLAVYEEALKAGAYPFIMNEVPGSQEIFYKHANDDQLDFVSPVTKMVMENFDASIYLGADYNTRKLSGTDPNRMARARKASSTMMKTSMQRSATGAFRWVVTVFPNNAMAQEADMSLADYREFVYGAGLLNDDDPVSLWKAEGLKQQKLIKWLKGHDQAVLKGSNVDLSFSIKERPFIECSGRVNFPDGEIFTGPVEDSANGWIRYKYPALFAGQEITDIELWFEQTGAREQDAQRTQS